GLLAEDTNLKSIDSAFIRNKRMILMEGAVFLVLLLGGAFYILRLHRRQERFVELKRNFLLGTTHELRSPIAAVKLNLQTLIQKDISAPNKDLLLNNSVSEINRLNNLIDNILLASKIDAKEYSFQLEAVPLSNLVAKTLQEARATGLAITDELSSDILVKGDRSALVIVINNLLDNARKYGGTAPIAVKLEEQHGKAVLSIADQGKGIPEKEQRNIWKRFYRIEDEQVRQSKGTGLGLFLVKSMTQLMNGSVDVANNSPQGSIFSISIPTL
nr:hypothetical protein [Saprospiraceae bacterium]